VPQEHAQWLVHGTDGVEVASTQAMAAARAFADGPLEGWLLILAGRATGCGKSFAAAWLQQRLLELAHEGHQRLSVWRYRSWTSTPLWLPCANVAALEGLWPSERGLVLQRLRETWLLVVDDLGTEPGETRRDWPGQLQALLEHRRDAQLLTICTTNLVEVENAQRRGKASAEWSKRYDRRLASRVLQVGDAARGELAAWVHCEGRDLRARTSPKLLPDQPEAKVGGAHEIDFDALARPLLEATDPRQLEDDARNVQLESAGLAEVAKRKVWGAVALRYLGEQAQQGEPWALDALDEVKRRAAR
jgi:hypothetical protein